MAQRKQNRSGKIALLLPEVVPGKRDCAVWRELASGLAAANNALVCFVNKANRSQWRKILKLPAGHELLEMDDLAAPDIQHFNFKLLNDALRLRVWSKANTPGAVVCQYPDTRVVYYQQANHAGLKWALGPLLVIAGPEPSFDMTTGHLKSPHETLWRTSITQQLRRSTDKLDPSADAVLKALKSGKGRIKKRQSREPLVTVCVTHFNYGEFLPEQLETLDAQTYSNLEIIVIDDASTDPFSRDAYARARKHYTSPKWKFVQKRSNSGIIKARETGLNKAKGEWILFADADNLCAADMVEKFVSAAIATGWDVVSSHSTVIDEKGNPVDYFAPSGVEPWLGAYLNLFGDNNSLFRTSVYKSYVSALSPSREGMEDWEMFFRLSLDAIPMGVIPESLFLYRRHGSSITARQPLSGIKRIRQVLREKNFNSNDLDSFITGAHLWMAACEYFIEKTKVDWLAHEASDRFWQTKEASWLNEKASLAETCARLKTELESSVDSHKESDAFWSEKESKWVAEREKLAESNRQYREQLEASEKTHRESDAFWNDKESKWKIDREQLTEANRQCREQLQASVNSHRESDAFWSDKESKWVAEREKLTEASGQCREQLESSEKTRRESEASWSEKESKWVAEREKLTEANRQYREQLESSEKTRRESDAFWSEKESKWMTERERFSSQILELKGSIESIEKSRLRLENELKDKETAWAGREKTLSDQLEQEKTHARDLQEHLQQLTDAAQRDAERWSIEKAGLEKRLLAFEESYKAALSQNKSDQMAWDADRKFYQQELQYFKDEWRFYIDTLRAIHAKNRLYQTIQKTLQQAEAGPFFERWSNRAFIQQLRSLSGDAGNNLA